MWWQQPVRYRRLRYLIARQYLGVTLTEDALPVEVNPKAPEVRLW
jgi:hypothetical protein